MHACCEIQENPFLLPSVWAHGARPRGMRRWSVERGGQEVGEMDGGPALNGRLRAADVWKECITRGSW